MMSTITAWQHIYSNVERDRSPTKTAGFQTLFYSHAGLNQNDIESIEERVFYVFAQTNPVKRVFFHLKTNKIVLGLIRPIDGKDAAGREGRYLSHTLIFPRHEFEASNTNPLDLFSSDLFMTSLEQAFAKGDATSGNINPLEIQLPLQRKESPPVISWDAEQLRKLVQFAINHKRFADNQTALALVGPTIKAEQTLSAIFSLLPAQISSQCTFDTFFERGGNLTFTYYWCAGFHASPRQPIFALVDVDKQTINDLDNYAKAATSFGRWVDVELASNNHPFITTHKQEAFALGGYIDQPIAEFTSTNLDERLLLSMLNANKQVVQDRINEKISEVLPPVLTEKIISSVLANVSPTAMITAMAKGFTADYLLSRLFSIYQAAGFQSPEKEERQALAEISKKHGHQQLTWLSLVWGGASWENPITRWRIKAGVEAMDEQTYKGFWDLAVPAKLVEPMDLLIDGKEAVFTALITRDQLLDTDDLTDLVKTLIKSDQHASIDLLTPMVHKLDKRQIKKINKLIENAEDIPDSFAGAIKNILV